MWTHNTYTLTWLFFAGENSGGGGLDKDNVDYFRPKQD